MTNYEKIKNMSVEEMANKLADISQKYCDNLTCDLCPFSITDGFRCDKYGIKGWLENE